MTRDNDLLVKAYLDLADQEGFDHYGVYIWRFPLLWMSFNGWGMKVTDAASDAAMIHC
jgi:hypothetical protein